MNLVYGLALNEFLCSFFQRSYCLCCLALQVSNFFFEQPINIIESFAFSPGYIYILGFMVVKNLVTNGFLAYRHVFLIYFSFLRMPIPHVQSLFIYLFIDSYNAQGREQ